MQPVTASTQPSAPVETSTTKVDKPINSSIHTLSDLHTLIGKMQASIKSLEARVAKLEKAEIKQITSNCFFSSGIATLKNQTSQSREKVKKIEDKVHAFDNSIDKIEDDLDRCTDDIRDIKHEMEEERERKRRNTSSYDSSLPVAYPSSFSATPRAPAYYSTIPTPTYPPYYYNTSGYSSSTLYHPQAPATPQIPKPPR